MTQTHHRKSTCKHPQLTPVPNLMVYLLKLATPVRSLMSCPPPKLMTAVPILLGHPSNWIEQVKNLAIGACLPLSRLTSWAVDRTADRPVPRRQNHDVSPDIRNYTMAGLSVVFIICQTIENVKLKIVPTDNGNEQMKDSQAEKKQ